MPVKVKIPLKKLQKTKSLLAAEQNKLKKKKRIQS